MTANSCPSGRLTRVASMLCVLVISACASSAPTRYFALETIAPATTSASESALPSYRGAAIDLRSVQIPPTLDRLEMVRELSPGQLELREFDHWAAPLARMARQTLVEDLALRLPSDRQASAGSTRVALTVDLVSFHLLDGQATLVVDWSIRWPATMPAKAAGSATVTQDPNATLSTGSARLTTPAGDDAGALERAWSELLAQTADRIAADLRDKASLR